MKGIILLAIFLPLNLFAQIHSAIEKYNTDSLESLIPRYNGTELIDVYNQLATSFSYDNPSLCEKFANQALSMARELDYKKGIGDAERFIGLMKMYEGRYPETVVHFYNALENYEQAEDTYSLAKLYYDFAKLNFYTGNYFKAEEYGLKSLELIEKKKPDGTTTGTLREISRLKSALGLLYRTANRPEQAKEIYRWYNGIMKKEGFEITDQMVHTQLLARCFDETGMYDSALFYFHKAYNFPEVNPSISALKFECLRSIGLVYYKIKNYREAVDYFIQVADGMDKAGFLYQTFLSNLILGNIYFEEEKLNQSEHFYDKALSLSEEMIRKQSYYRYDSLRFVVSYGAELYFPWPEKYIKKNIWECRLTITEKLHKLNRVKGEWQKSLAFLALNSIAKDTVYALQRNRDLLEMQTKYETSRKEQQIEQLDRENNYKEQRLDQSRIIMAGLGLMMIMLVFIGILLIRQNRIKTQQKMVILEQKLLRSQMNPHFIFNSMASIQDFILAKDTRSAASYLSRFAMLIRNILDASLEETIPLTKEIDTIEHYLELQKVRLEEKVDFIIIKNEAFEDEELRIPAFLVQPFVENAIEHGIRHKAEKGIVKVEFRKQGPWLSVVVEDNGVGRANAFKFEEIKRKGHTSVSTTLVQERLKILNRRSRRKISVEIRDLADDAGNANGTRVEIRVPVG
jgi:tetratricopeptide (TPR) repeat protein